MNNKMQPFFSFWQSHNRYFNLLLAFIAGCALPLALAPYYAWPLAFISPMILFVLLKKQSNASAMLLSWAFGTGMWLVGAFWLYTSIHVFGGVPSAYSLLLVVLMALAMGLFSALQGYLYQRFFAQSALAFSLLWVLFEWIKTWLFTGFPWLFVGYAFSDLWLGSFAPVFGVFFVSFAVVFAATSLVQLKSKQYVAFVLSISILIIAVMLSAKSWSTKTDEDGLSVSIVQGNIPQNMKWLTEYQDVTIQRYFKLTEAFWQQDLIVWPEAAIPLFQYQVEPLLEQVKDKTAEENNTWVTGIPYAGDVPNPWLNPIPKTMYNSMLSISKGSSTVYHKQRLVPFGEYVPFYGILNWLVPSITSQYSPQGMNKGGSDQAGLKVGAYQAAAAVCYEIAFPDLMRRNTQQKDLIITVSNEAWFDGSHELAQHLQMAQMRARENARWLVRATNTGVSAVINDQGEVVKQAPQRVQAVLQATIYPMQGRTPYSFWGDYPVLIFSVLCLLILRLRSKK